MRRFSLFLCLLVFMGLTSCSETAETEASTEGTPSPIINQFPAGQTIDIEFVSGENTLSGIFDTPEGQAEGLIIFIHGYGPSDVRGQNSYAVLRRQFNELGFATTTWDKPGQGRSSGTFDINQSVFESAEEVLAAAEYFRSLQAPGSHNIGLWGISRAGWIAPIALSQDDDITFWISVSGVTAEDNFPYLLLSNLPHEGISEEETAKIATEWKAGCEAFRMGLPYEAYLTATPHLRANAYIEKMRGPNLSKDQYENQQQSCKNAQCESLESELCAYIFVKDFDEMLRGLDVDVLALFGEKDLNIDWKKVRNLYEDTIGTNPEADLTIQIFADADHNLNVAETGSLSEMMTRGRYERVEGYFDVQTEWLKSEILK